MKEKIKEDIELYKYLYEHAHEMYVSVSPADASILKVNDTLCKTLGYDRNELIGKPVFKVYHEDCLEQVKVAFNKFTKDGFVKNAELILKKKDGEKIYVILNVSSVKDDKGNILYSRSSWVDISSLKAKEDELNKVKDLLRNSNEAARIGTWELDIVEQKLTWSQMTKEIHEVPTDYEPQLQTAINFYKEGHSREQITQAVNQAMESGKGYTLELQIVTNKGNDRWVRAIGLAEIKNGSCVRLYGIFQDIHEKKIAKLELETVLDVTNEQNKRLLNFAHIVSHNLRSHSGNLSMTLGFLEDEKDDGQKEELMAMLRKSVDNLEETIRHLNDVVAVNTTSSEKLEPIELETHINSAIENVQGLLIEVSGKILTKKTSSERVMAIPAYLDSVLLNFLTNAIKYRAQERKLEIKLSFEKREKKIAITISDNGLGIDLKRHGEKLFRMYKTFHNNKDARGIGLFITKNQIEAMGGSVSVQSELNKGTTFTILLNEAS